LEGIRAFPTNKKPQPVSTNGLGLDELCLQDSNNKIYLKAVWCSLYQNISLKLIMKIVDIHVSHFFFIIEAKNANAVSTIISPRHLISISYRVEMLSINAIRIM
jgi:hypothetical protein